MSGEPNLHQQIEVQMQRNIESRLRRRSGASPEARERLQSADTFEDWWAVCRVCGRTSQGKTTDLHKGCETCTGGPHEDHQRN